MYTLSTSLLGHDDDVKCLAALNDDCLVSGSRDSTVRVWHRSGSSKNFNSSIINHKSDKFINAVTIYENAAIGSSPMIASAGNDNLINLTDINGNFLENTPEYCFLGHTANICTLDVKDGLILSGSWDSTAKVWNSSGEVVYDLKGNENSVWSAKFVTNEEFLTCGADRTIRKYYKNKQVSKIIAHDDVVRDLLLLPNGDFASCSNDSTIKIWDYDTLTCKATLLGHQSFIYSLALLPNGDIVSCGEDRSVRIWSNNQCIQVITIPCISVWKVITLNNGDIVTASSDKTIRIFTKDQSRHANSNELLYFQKELENSSINELSLSNVDKKMIPGIESLNSNDPKIEGETKLVKSNNSAIEIYQWSNNEWIKIGTMVDSSSATSNEKKFYKGDFYDYVFDVDIEEGKPPLKLPVNLSDNPYDVAEKFLADYNLPYSYLQEVVNFILKNAEGISLDDKPAAKSTILPQKVYLTFEGMDQIKLIAAFKKLNSKQSEENKIYENFETLLNCEDFEGIHKLALLVIQQWEGDSKLFGFDILRAIITKIQPSEDLFPIISTGLKLSSKIQMMTIRILINTFTAKPWGEQMMLDDEILNLIFTPSLFENLENDPKFLPVTISTLILNFSVLINKFQLLNFHEKMLAILEKILSWENVINNEESAYRLIIGIGTLNYMKQFPVENFISRIKIQSTRIEEVRKEIL